MIVSLPQAAGPNVLTYPLPPTKEHSADSSVSSGMKLNLSPAHILTVNFNTYAIYVPMILKLQTSLTKPYTARNIVVLGPRRPYQAPLHQKAITNQNRLCLPRTTSED